MQFVAHRWPRVLCWTIRSIRGLCLLRFPARKPVESKSLPPWIIALSNERFAANPVRNNTLARTPGFRKSETMHVSPQRKRGDQKASRSSARTRKQRAQTSALLGSHGLFQALTASVPKRLAHPRLANWTRSASLSAHTTARHDASWPGACRSPRPPRAPGCRARWSYPESPCPRR
jgi:hypothetical protein